MICITLLLVNAFPCLLGNAEDTTMRVLVTGGTGFIGIHLIAALAARGWSVRCLVRQTSDRRPLAAYALEYVVGTLQDEVALRQAVQGVELVFHLAGATKGRTPADFERVNYVGTQTLLDVCVAEGTALHRFVYISSIAAAGPSPSGVPVHESDVARPVGPYGRSKLHAEEAVLASKARLPVTVLRPSAIYGPYDSDFLPLFRAVKRGFLPSVGRQELCVDVCYVTDVVRGMLAAAESPATCGELFFLSGSAHSWRDIGWEIARQLGTRPREVCLPRWLVLAAATMANGQARLLGRPGVFSRAHLRERLYPFWVFDRTKAQQVFGYVPQVTLTQGIAKTLRWYREAGWV
jgi:nucleoside-diphosphate-sugar epimerase